MAMSPSTSMHVDCYISSVKDSERSQVDDMIQFYTVGWKYKLQTTSIIDEKQVRMSATLSSVLSRTEWH